MTSRLIILVIAIIFFSFGFYLLSYQNNFDQHKPLNMKLATDTFKAHELLVSPHEHAAPAAEEAIQKEIVIDLENPVIKHGHEIFHNLGQCVTCHGDQAQGLKEKNAPLLAGQEEWYTLSQLTAFKNGTRKNEVMLPFIKDLTEQDFKDVAEYIKLLRIKASPQN